MCHLFGNLLHVVLCQPAGGLVQGKVWQLCPGQRDKESAVSSHTGGLLLQEQLIKGSIGGPIQGAD